MQIHNVQQGSDEWAHLRAQHYTASEASAMMGVSQYTTRAELLRQKATGVDPEPSEYQLRLMRQGHEYEQAARPIAEEIIGEELYPATVTEDVEELPLLASVDGMDMLGETLWEHKTYRDDLAEQVNAGQVPEGYIYQLEQQALVTGASWVLFMVSDGTRERCAWCWYQPDPERQQKLIRGWWQFHSDLSEYEPPQDDGPAPSGSAPEQLPALRVEVRGEVTASNVDEFKQHAQEVIEGINTDLQTDEDFASAEKTVKWAKEVESRIDAAKEHALAQTEDLDRLFRTLDEVRELARSKRLELKNLVEARKKAVREEIIAERQRTLADMASAHEKELGVRIDPGANFAAAIKGKKTVKSVRDAADQELADAKLRLQEEAERIRGNLARFRELSEDYPALFPDWTDLVRKAGDDMEATVKARIAEEQERERKRAEAERERIRQEEERKAREAAEQERKQLEAERESAQQDPAVDQGQPESPAAAVDDLNDAEHHQDMAAQSGDAVGIDPATPGGDYTAVEERAEVEISCSIKLRVPARWSDADIIDQVQGDLSDIGLRVSDLRIQRKQEEAA